ncbi:flavoprotein [Allokutzneria sp. A3M-2-11 16]|uniref:flavoprotein n=1 Tax=Allokutzneria sp. A3M-2-11 16 TaxID=2962043 RepID=UPI0020B6719F|nr:flavoprotein [Allokutzneria sp. A3M-2-11 16]MCP3799219.1 flavoprotein [Allokutzneria sp. A3M-2-11 16]
MKRVLGLMCSATFSVLDVRERVVEPAVQLGWRVAITLTPNAFTWFEAAGEVEVLRELTGLPVRGASRLPTEPRPHPVVDCYLWAPASANSVAKLALGLGDNQALTTVSEAIGSATPVVVLPQVSEAHTRHPAWDGHIAALRAGGVELVPDLAWDLALERVERVTG